MRRRRLRFATPPPSPCGVDTVGHGDLDMLAFVELLGWAGARMVVDVRDASARSGRPEMGAAALDRDLRDLGMEYIDLASDLGHHDAIDPPDAFWNALTWVEGRGTWQRVTLLGAAEDPTWCPRRRIARLLIANGTDVHHLRSNGRRQADDELEAATWMVRQE